MLDVSNSPGFKSLTVENLSYNINESILIDQLSFTIKSPGITAIMGPNGAGKSLTLRLLHGLIKPKGGRIIWQINEGTTSPTTPYSAHNQPEIYNEKTNKALATSQAMVFQKPVLLRRSVIENLRYALKVKGIKDRAAQLPLLNAALKMANLQDRQKSPARRLSGGEQQRLAMARALMLRPAILLLDEPTSSLDPASTAAVEALISKASSDGTKVILISHDIGQAKRLADDIIFLNEGKLAEQAAAAELINTPKSRPARQYFSGDLVLET